jgi:hypothetical protein
MRSPFAKPITPAVPTQRLITAKRAAQVAVALAALAALVATTARAEPLRASHVSALSAVHSAPSGIGASFSAAPNAAANAFLSSSPSATQNGPTATAQPEAPRNPCTAQGWHETRALLDDAGVPATEDLLTAYTTLFCKAAPMSRAATRVGFPFAQTSPGETGHLNNTPAAQPHLFTMLMDRNEFIEHYRFLSVNDAHEMDNYKPIATIEAARYSNKHDIATLTQAANDCGQATLQFRRYQGKWIWFSERIEGCGV